MAFRDPIPLGERIKNARLREGLTQEALADKVGATQGAVWNWENGGNPSKKSLEKLENVLGTLKEIVPGGKPNQNKGEIPNTDVSAYGVWLRKTREAANMSVPELAKTAGVSLPTIYNIEGGKASNPQSSTRHKLETALKTSPSNEIVENTTETQKIEGLGELIDFDPHDKQGWPQCKGVYALYDISQRPIYVGKAGTSIALRLGAHYEKFWFKEPIVKYGSYIEIADKETRHQLEQVLIKFLKSNAVINKQSTESFDPE